MKLREADVFYDTSLKSISMLKQRCLDFFEQSQIEGPVWFVDDTGPFDHFPEQDSTVNVVFFGNFFKRFFESGNWPFSQMRLWCLSPQVQKSMVEILGIPANQIGVIPRESLFKSMVQKVPSSFEGTWVYGGRISATKNIEMLLHLVHVLQTEHGLAITLKLYGEFDDFVPPEAGRWLGHSYKERIVRLIKSLAWRQAPEIIHGKNPDEWLDAHLKNPLLVSLSTFICEDFAVSAAQAQELGWPCILSDWGGHRDLQGAVYAIHPVRIGNFQDPTAVIQFKAQALASLMMKKKNHWALKSNPSMATPQIKSINMGQLDGHRRHFISHAGPDAQHIYREGLDAFSYTNLGKKTFSALESIFAGASPGGADVVFTNDLNEEIESVQHVQQICQDILQTKVDAVFIPMKQANTLSTLDLLQVANRIVLPFFTPPMAAVVKLWLNFGIKASMEIHCTPSQLSEAREKLTPYLRPQDQLKCHTP